MPDVQAIANSIYNRALQGTPVNVGLPDTLAGFVAQMAAHETGGFTSNAWHQDNNAFGYKYVGSRYQAGPGIASSEGDNYGRYRNYLDSVDEVVDWIYRRQREGIFPADLRSIKTAAQFAQLLKNGKYYGDPVAVYTNGLNNWPIKFAVKATVAGSAILLGLAVWAFANRKKLAS